MANIGSDKHRMGIRTGSLFDSFQGENRVPHVRLDCVQYADHRNGLLWLLILISRTALELTLLLGLWEGGAQNGL